MSVLAAGVRQHPTVQVATAAAWSCLCIFMVVQLSRSLDKQHIQLLWTYFQPIGPPLLLLWLWSITVAHFEKQQIPFDVCFPEKERKLLAASKDLFAAARAYSCAVVGGLALCAWLCTTGSSLTPLLVPPVLYGTMAALTVMPVDVLRLQSRRFFVRTLCKVLVPVQQVGWADFLLADMLTSLAKSSSDMSRSMCLMVHGEQLKWRLSLCLVCCVALIAAKGGGPTQAFAMALDAALDPVLHSRPPIEWLLRYKRNSASSCCRHGCLSSRLGAFHHD
eukprot:GHUV01015912.1.p1 GENE.GHUV01015912.1~~GHUV01015912.1.p1  ORF type:complete len:277 (+),score=36.87 GHUV01015912.1:708-1538(+)